MNLEEWRQVTAGRGRFRLLQVTLISGTCVNSGQRTICSVRLSGWIGAVGDGRTSGIVNSTISRLLSLRRRHSSIRLGSYSLNAETVVRGPALVEHCPWAPWTAVSGLGLQCDAGLHRLHPVDFADL